MFIFRNNKAKKLIGCNELREVFAIEPGRFNA
nr:MAG TPA: hypothetical protein [Caudoviricetes sp.]